MIFLPSCRAAALLNHWDKCIGTDGFTAAAVMVKQGITEKAETKLSGRWSRLFSFIYLFGIHQRFCCFVSVF